MIILVTNPAIPLTQQQWFHGAMSRIEAEALLEDDDLVHFFTSTKLPLVIAGVDVFLNHPVLTVFP